MRLATATLNRPALPAPLHLQCRLACEAPQLLPKFMAHMRWRCFNKVGPILVMLCDDIPAELSTYLQLVSLHAHP
jgi:hypothetical protein